MIATPISRPEAALRIAMVSEHASPAALLGGEDAGGQNVYVDEVSRQLGRSGHRVDVFTRREAADAPLVQAWASGVRIVNLPAGPAHRLRKDDLWPHMPAFRDALLRFAAVDGVRYDIAHGNFWMSGWVVAELRRSLGIPGIQLFHALGVTKRRHQGDADTSPSDRIATERRVVREVDRVIASCPAEVDELVEDYRARRSRIETIPLGVDGAMFCPVDRTAARARVGLGLEARDQVVVYVGRVVPRKDVRNVVAALAHLDWQDPGGRDRRKLVIVGGESPDPDLDVTPELGEIRRLAFELGVSGSVLFAGKRPTDELRDYYGAADVVVTTPWYEPFGLTPLEAMACGRPVIGSAVGGIAYSVVHGETGLLVPPRDPPGLAAAMAELLDDPDRRERLGHNARRRAEQAFTWPVVAARTAALYRQVLDERDDRGDIAPEILGRSSSGETISAGD